MRFLVASWLEAGVGEVIGVVFRSMLILFCSSLLIFDVSSPITNMVLMLTGLHFKRSAASVEIIVSAPSCCVLQTNVEVVSQRVAVISEIALPTMVLAFDEFAPASCEEEAELIPEVDDPKESLELDWLNRRPF